MTGLDGQNGSKAVAGVGSTILTEAGLTVLLTTPALDSVQLGVARLAAARNWQQGELITRQGRNQDVYDEIATRVAGYSAWRGHLLDAVAKRQINHELDGEREQIEAIYNFRNTAIQSRYLVAVDSIAAAGLRQRWQAGDRFETLALNVFTSADILDAPGEPGWKYPKELDAEYARIAYNQSVGEVSRPILIGGKYYLIQTLRTHFRPEHGHFERPKHKQNIAGELPENVGITLAEAEASLDEWVAGLPLKWRRWQARKVLKSGVLARHQRSTAAEAPTPEILGIVLFTLAGSGYDVDWMLERLELLPPDTHLAVDNNSELQTIITSILKWNRLLETIADMPAADAIILEAEQLKQSAIGTTGWQTLQHRYLADYTIPDDILEAYLTANRADYVGANQVNTGEIVLDDSLFAAVLADSIRDGASFGALAAAHSMRKWSRTTDGELGWIPERLYYPHTDSLKLATKETLVGPLAIDAYYVLLKVHGHRKAPEPIVRDEYVRLRYNWLLEYADSLVYDWIWAVDRTEGLSWLDTNLVLGIDVPEVQEEPLQPPLELTTRLEQPDSLSYTIDADSSTATSADSIFATPGRSPTVETGITGTDTLAVPASNPASPDPR